MTKTIATLLLFLSSSTVQAEWFNQSNENAFDDTVMQLSVTGNHRGYGFGMRCKTSSDVEIVLLTPEEILPEDEAKVRILNAAKPLLLLRIDKNPIVEIEGTIDVVDSKLMIVVPSNAGHVKLISDGKSRIAAAISVLGKRLHESEFSATGSARSLTKLISACSKE
jgi:hypothetical protein